MKPIATTLRTSSFLLASTLMLVFSAPAQAQSGYTLSTLQSGASAVPLTREQDFFIDAQQRVMGRTSYDTGTVRLPICIPYLYLFCSPGGKVYAAEAVVWPASTASTVQPVKLLPYSLPEGAGTAVAAASPSGRLLSLEAANEVFDTSTGALIGMNDQLEYPGLGYGPGTLTTIGRRSIDNTGVVALNGINGASYLWDLGPLLGRTTDVSVQTKVVLPQALPNNGNAETRVNALRDRNLVVGEVIPNTNQYSPIDPYVVMAYPARWVNGVLQLLDQQYGRAIAVNAAGQIVVQRLPKSYVVWTNGASSTIAPLTSGQVVVPNAINASGVVVGRSGAPASIPKTYVDAYDNNARAFIWKNGVTTDLAQFLKAKGLSLPSGTVVEDAKDINDQGSMVVVLRNWLGTRSIARLTAKP